MQIPVIIMAGGKSKRFNFHNIEIKYKEKTLLPFKNRYMIEHIIDAVLAASNINKVIIAVSPFTIHTKSIIKKKRMPIELINTPGIDYHSDLSYIINSLNLHITMIISADLPLIKPNILDNIIEKFFTLDKPALTVMAFFELFNKYGITPKQFFKSDKYKKDLVPIGINIIDGRLINQLEIDQTIFISSQEELVFNINTTDDYYKLLAFQNKKSDKI